MNRSVCATCSCPDLYCSLNGSCVGPIVKNIVIQGDGASIVPVFDPNITTYTLNISLSGSVFCYLRASFGAAPVVAYPSTTCPTSSSVCGGCVHVSCPASGNWAPLDIDAFNWADSTGEVPETIDRISVLFNPPRVLSYTFSQGSITVTYTFNVNFI